MATKKANHVNNNPLTVNPETFQGWSKLEPNEQEQVREESRALADARHTEAQSKLSIGEHLSNIRKVLEPKRMFVSFLSEIFDMSRATAYRYMNLYELAQAKMPAPVLELAIAKGTRISAKALEENPVPKTQDRGVILEYLSSLRPTREEPEKSQDQLLKECVNFVGTRFQQLPTQHPKTKQHFIRTLVGMLLNKFGIATETTFTPVAIPESFRSSRGRPRQQEAA